MNHRRPRAKADPLGRASSRDLPVEEWEERAFGIVQSGMNDFSADRRVPTEEIVGFLVARLSGRVGRTALLKLIYLADLEARRYLGRPLSALEYHLHQFGPFDSAIYEAIGALQVQGEIAEEAISFAVGTGYRYETRNPGRPFNLERAEEELLTHVVRTYASRSLESILDLVYDTVPMKSVESAPLGTRIPMERVDNQMRLRLAGVSLERALRAEDEVAKGQTVSWQELRVELLNRGRTVGEG